MTEMAMANGLDYITKGGISVTRRRKKIAYEGAIDKLIDDLDSHRGAIFSSNYEYPGRYTRWDSGIIDPPVVITTQGRNVKIEALTKRGEVLLEAIISVVTVLPEVIVVEKKLNLLRVKVKESETIFSEEERSRMPSVFTVLRAIVDLFFSTTDNKLGLYGAFGYDLAFQFEPIDFKIKRPDDQRDLVLYLPDSILIADHYSASAWMIIMILPMQVKILEIYRVKVTKLPLNHQL